MQVFVRHALTLRAKCLGDICIGCSEGSVMNLNVLCLVPFVNKII